MRVNLATLQKQLKIVFKRVRPPYLYVCIILIYFKCETFQFDFKLATFYGVNSNNSNNNNY